MHFNCTFREHSASLGPLTVYTVHAQCTGEFTDGAHYMCSVLHPSPLNLCKYWLHLSLSVVFCFRNVQQSHWIRWRFSVIISKKPFIFDTKWTNERMLWYIINLHFFHLSLKINLLQDIQELKEHLGSQIELFEKTLRQFLLIVSSFF